MVLSPEQSSKSFSRSLDFQCNTQIEIEICIRCVNICQATIPYWSWSDLRVDMIWQWACININAVSIFILRRGQYCLLRWIISFFIFDFSLLLDQLKGSRAFIGTFVLFIFLLVINVGSNFLTIDFCLVSD